MKFQFYKFNFSFSFSPINFNSFFRKTEHSHINKGGMIILKPEKKNYKIILEPDPKSSSLGILLPSSIIVDSVSHNSQRRFLDSDRFYYSYQSQTVIVPNHVYSFCTQHLIRFFVITFVLKY